MALHPRCVCSRASVAELARLLSETKSPIAVSVLAYQPDGGSGSWAQSDLLDQLHSVPGVAVVPDSGGRMARSLGLTVSGETALFSPGGRQQFRGGITFARGHEGDNAGRASIAAIFARQAPPATSTPVFGCSIQDGR